MWIFPSVGSTSHVKFLKVVDLPAPLTPSKAKHSPDWRPKERFSTATRGMPEHAVGPFCSLSYFVRRQRNLSIQYTFLKFWTLILNFSGSVSATRFSSLRTSSSISALSLIGTSHSHYLVYNLLHLLPRSISIKKSTKNQNTKWPPMSIISKVLFYHAHSLPLISPPVPTEASLHLASSSPAFSKKITAPKLFDTEILAT